MLGRRGSYLWRGRSRFAHTRSSRSSSGRCIKASRCRWPKTLGGYLDGWLQDVGRPKLRPCTCETYELLIRRHIKPLLGDRRPDHLTARDIRRSMDRKLDKGLQREHRPAGAPVIRTALEQAAHEDVLPREDTLAEPRLRSSGFGQETSDHPGS
jgi:hypothetical protein